ncbi:hypothetical protein LJC14_03915 [Treponema sp. OttesenSCG-928-L16]|nr:hypothetical protein [Treponema sp. OttesenSCG-928-L16]
MKIVRLLISVSLVFLFAACMSEPVAWDNSLPEDQTATVVFYGITPISYNGIAVEDWVNMKIPAGDALITCDVTANTYSARNKTFKYSFKGGNGYLVAFNVDQNGYWGVGIYDNPDNKWSVKKDALITFIRF